MVVIHNYQSENQVDTYLTPDQEFMVVHPTTTQFPMTSTPSELTEYLGFSPIFYEIYGFYLIAFLIYIVTVRSYKRTWTENNEEWKKFPEYPIFHHAYYIINMFYSIAQFLVVSSLVFFIGFCIPYSNIQYLSAFFLSVSSVALAVLTYILIIFGQVYSILISIVVSEDIIWRETLTDYEIAKKQIEKKLLIRYLFRALLVRDFILTPAFICFDYKGSIKHFALTPTFLITTHITIYAMVPIMMFGYLAERYFRKRRNLDDSRPPLNIFQKQVLRQILGITVVQMILFAVSGVLSIFDKFSFTFANNVSAGSLSTFTYLPHAIGILLPGIILVVSYYANRQTTVSRVRRCREGEYSVSEC